MSFKEIFCQDKAIDTLQRAFAAGKWAHAYIFAGIEGAGKFKTALEWAKLLGCAEPATKDGFTESCGSCDSCRLFDAGASPDFHHIYKELLEFTKNNQEKKTPRDLSIDVIRELLIAKVPAKPTVSQRKVFVVSEAEKLNASSQNALLKVLEEPPEYCCIILLCTRMERLLPTTKSRCQTVRFGPIDQSRIIKKLGDMGLEQEQARYFARLAEGSLGSACRWAELELADANLFETGRQISAGLASLETADALNMAAKLVADSKRIATVWADLDKNTSKTDINRRAAGTLLRMIILNLHDAMIFGAGAVDETIGRDQINSIKKLAGRYDAERAAEMIADCYRMLHWIESNVNEKLIFEQLLLSLADSAKMPVL